MTYKRPVELCELPTCTHQIRDCMANLSVVKSFGPTVFMNFGPGKSGFRSHLGHPVTVVCCRGFVCSGSEPAAGSVDDHFLGPGWRAGARDLWSPSRCLFGCSRRA